MTNEELRKRYEEILRARARIKAERRPVGDQAPAMTDPAPVDGQARPAVAI